MSLSRSSRTPMQRILQEKHMSKKLRRLAAAVCLFCAGLAWARVGGSIAGTVKDPSGRVLPHAEVPLRQSSPGLPCHARSDSKAHYNFPVLPVARYDLHVQDAGFPGYERTNV